MATPSPMNRGYGSGLAANRAPSTGLAANRAPSTGLAAGAPAGGGFRSSFQSSYSAPPPMQPAQQQPQRPTPDLIPAPLPAPEPPPPVDFSNMFGSQPLPAPGQQSFNQQPPSPFGPAPLPFGGFRQQGGPVMPGQAYIVGEAGPELIVPQQPGMVLPNPTLTGRASAQDGAVRSGPLSTRGATPVGSGRGMTPERRLEIAARRGDPRANLTLFNAQQFGRNARGAARALPPPMPMPMGRAPQAMTRPMPMQEPAMEMMPMPAQPQAQTAPQFDMSNMLPPMAPAMLPPQPAQAPFRPQGPRLDPMAPLPPSTLMGGTGVPAAPPIDNKNPMPLIPTPEQVQAFGLQPDFSKPQTYQGRQFPTFSRPPAAETQRWQLYDAPGPMVPHPYIKDMMVPGPPIKRQVDPITGETRDLVEQGTSRPAAGASGQGAAAPGDAQAPGWMDWLKQKTASK